MNNFEKIFLFFAEPGTSLLYYKDFIRDIFNFTSIRDLKNYKSKNKYNENLTFVEILTKKIMDKNGIFTLLDLIKNIKIIDYEDTHSIALNDFYLALKKVDITLDEEEKERIFLEYDYFTNSAIKYEIMFDLILDQFWNERKDNIAERFYCFLTDNGKRYTSINNMERLFNDLIGNNNSKRKLMNIIEEYKLVNNNKSVEPLSLQDVKKFLKFYSFGHGRDKRLINLLSLVDPCLDNHATYDSFNNLKQYFNETDRKCKKHKYSRSVDKNCDLPKMELFKTINRLRKTFMEYGRKTFFNFIKQFKYYENIDKQIDRNNFLKVFNSYNINLSREEIDIIFNKFGINEYKNLIYYEDFLKYISVNCSNHKRENTIKYIFDTIGERSEKFSRDIDISFLKEIYNPKNNYFIKNESDNNLDFIDCLETFHYCYKSFKRDDFYKKEFIEFYRFISFLIYSDDDFACLMSHEWRVPLNYINKYLYEVKNLPNKNGRNPYEDRKLKNYFLLDLKNKLVNKGVKGLISLHWKFLNFCPNVSKITLNDFVNIFQMEHINFDQKDFHKIFSYFSLDSKNVYLDYNRFIRFFKMELNDNKLNIVEKIFLSLKYDLADEENIPLNQVKKKYSARRHPEVVSGKKIEDEKILEFSESFDTNYDICSLDQNSGKIGKFVDFDIFANYYEYVSFIYYNDDDFSNLLASTWC